MTVAEQAYAFPLGVVVGVDVIELARGGRRNVDGENWHRALASLRRALSSLSEVKKVEGPLVNGIVAVTFEGAHDVEFYRQRIERVARRVFQISCVADSVTSPPERG